MSQFVIPSSNKSDYVFDDGVIGEGAYSIVKKCTEKESGREFAVKIVEKSFIRKEKKV